MARKTKEEAEKTRCKILDAALTVFNQKGFVRSTLSDIAKAAGVTRGAIYWHFKDKADLLAALTEYIQTSTGTRLEDFMQKSFRSLADIREVILNYLSHFESDARFRKFYELVTYKTEYNQELEAILAKERQETRAIMKRFEDDFRQIQSSGGARQDLDAGHAAIMTAAFVGGLIELWIFDQTHFSIKETAPALIDAFLQSMAPAVSDGN